MSENKNDHVVVAFYDSAEIADQAVASLKAWDKASDDIKLGAVGVLAAAPDGKIKTHVGRKSGKGAKTGAIVGVIAGVLSGGVTLVGGLIGGALAGGVLGGFFKKGTNLTEDEINNIGEELKRGKYAVVVTCDEDELPATKDQLQMVGGVIWTYEVSAEAMTAAAEAATSAEIAMDQAAAVAGPAAGVLAVAGASAAAAHVGD
ncbi:MAG TPA: hypothetical protein PKL67_17990 [Anaerolineae bacterium]|nr:hypothetical protein [Anaerolineae bacterium]